MSQQDVIHVEIGEVKLGKSPQVLKAILGSCVGIAFVWKKMNRFALAHCLLAEAPEQIPQIGAKYVTQAIPSILTLLKLKEDHYSEVEVYLAGGANMVEQEVLESKINIGGKNVATALEKLKELGIEVKKSELRGTRGRRITVYCEDGSVEIQDIPKEGDEVSNE